ncbi:MAG: hypothetical protein IPI91_09575 [Flavobacteriales bacterium]|nr:hypothetical protein [Flavobacteriales bacterium]
MSHSLWHPQLPGDPTTSIFSVLVLKSCETDDTNDPVLARAFDNELHWSDLRQVIPVSSTEMDSAALAQRYITNWSRDQVLVHRAEQNLGEEQKDFVAQLEDYRKDRLIYAYEEALVSQKLDTVVSDPEIEAYWKENEADFGLKDSMLRVRWSKVHGEDKRSLGRLKKAFNSKDNEELREYEVWLASRGIPIVDRSSEWISIQELGTEVIPGRSSLSDLVTGPGKMVIENGSDAYFMDILELRSRDSVAPLNMVVQDIRSIIINQRKLQFVEKIREDLYREALEQKDVEIF